MSPLRERANRQVITLRRPHATMFLLTTSLLSLLASSGAAFSQTAERPMPTKAHAKPYGTGWQCDFGHLERNGSCVPIQTPANAHLTELSFGRGWECDRGYRVSGDLCTKVEVPANAYLTDSPNGTRGWACNRGYRPIDEMCSPIMVPENGYMADTAYGLGWSAIADSARRAKPA